MKQPVRRPRSGPQIHLVIFDLDGTLIDAYAAVAESVNHVMRELVMPRVRKEQIIRAVGWGERHLLARFVPPDRLDKAAAMYRKHHVLALKTGTRLLPGAKRLLTFLREYGYRMAVASNRADRFSRLVLKVLGIEQYFEAVLCRDKVKNPKPHPDILLGLVRRMHVRPGEAVFVGDMTVDMEAGRRAGIRTIAVTTGSSTRRELRQFQPLAVIGRVDGVMDVIKKIEGGRLDLTKK